MECHKLCAHVTWFNRFGGDGTQISRKIRQSIRLSRRLLVQYRRHWPGHRSGANVAIIGRNSRIHAIRLLSLLVTRATDHHDAPQGVKLLTSGSLTTEKAAETGISTTFY